MRRFFGYLLIILGLLLTAAIVFLAFGGKYGLRQFVTHLSSFRVDAGLLSYVIASLGMAGWGIHLLRCPGR